MYRPSPLSSSKMTDFEGSLIAVFRKWVSTRGRPNLTDVTITKTLRQELSRLTRGTVEKTWSLNGLNNGVQRINYSNLICVHITCSVTISGKLLSHLLWWVMLLFLESCIYLKSENNDLSSTQAVGLILNTNVLAS